MVYNIYEKRPDVLKEQNSGELLTVPDQSLPLAVLLERAQRGQLDVANYFRTPDYDSQADAFNEVPERPLDGLDAAQQLSRMESRRNVTEPAKEQPQESPSGSSDSQPAGDDSKPSV